MVIALLAVLGVGLIVIVAFLGVVLSRRRWLSRQPGAFKGAIRVVDGEVSGLGSKWKRGYGRWVRDVLVWTKAPLLFQSELVAVDGLADAVRAAEPGAVKRLGSDPMIVPLAADGGARFEVAAAANDRGWALGRWRPLRHRLHSRDEGAAGRPGRPAPGRQIQPVEGRTVVANSTERRRCGTREVMAGGRAARLATRAVGPRDPAFGCRRRSIRFG